MIKLSLGAFLATVIISTAALADDLRPTGRYQMMILEQGTGVEEVLILDTQEGNLWRYWLASTVGKYPGGEGVKFITKVQPGTKPGEIIFSETFK